MAARGAPGVTAGAAAAGPDPTAVRALPLDEYAALLLGLGRSRVDPATGAVVGPKGRPLVPQRNSQTGHSHVQLCYHPGAPRGITVHRLVALAAWGAAAVRGRHVVHRDGDRAHNAVANLALVAPPAPNRPPRPGAARPGATAAPPCARCGTTGGTVRTPGRPPCRTSGARFGLGGRLCAVCYEGLRRQERRRLARAAGAPGPGRPRAGDKAGQRAAGGLSPLRGASAPAPRRRPA